MKWLATLMLLLSVRVHATGCGGGDWRETNRRDLPDTQITTRSGEFRIRQYQGRVWISVEDWTLAGKDLSFYSDPVALRDIDISAFIAAIGDRPAIPARTYEVEITNFFYDDCTDAPEGAKRIETHYEMVIDLPGGLNHTLKAEIVVYEPPPAR